MCVAQDNNISIGGANTEKDVGIFHFEPLLFESNVSQYFFFLIFHLNQLFTYPLKPIIY